MKPARLLGVDLFRAYTERSDVNCHINGTLIRV